MAQNNMIDSYSNPFALVRLAASVSNVTGDGTNYKLIFDTLANGVGYNTATGVFTASLTGNYLMTAIVACTNLLTAHNDGALEIVITSTVASSNGTFLLNEVNIGSLRTASNISVLNGTGSFLLNANDTWYFNLRVSGSTKTVGVSGNNFMYVRWNS